MRRPPFFSFSFSTSNERHQQQQALPLPGARTIKKRPRRQDKRGAFRLLARPFVWPATHYLCLTFASSSSSSFSFSSFRLPINHLHLHLRHSALLPGAGSGPTNAEGRRLLLEPGVAVCGRHRAGQRGRLLRHRPLLQYHGGLDAALPVGIGQHSGWHHEAAAAPSAASAFQRVSSGG